MIITNLDALKNKISLEIGDLNNSSYSYQLSCNYKKNREIQDKIRKLYEVMNDEKKLINYFFPKFFS